MHTIKPKYICSCSYCGSCTLHNMKIGVFMVETNSGNGENIEQSNPVVRAAGRLNALKLFFYGVFRYAGLFLLGIFVGMGIVLKNPPQNTDLKKKIEDLQTEVKENASDLTVKTSYVIK